MQIKVIDSFFNETTGTTIITVSTPYGVFKGQALFNAEAEKFPPSTYVGMEIAESRACIAAYNEAIKRKKEQLKGIKRLIFSCDNNALVLRYANRIKNSITTEINDLLAEKEDYQKAIKIAIEARGIYTRSRLVSKEERERYLKDISDGLKALGQNSSKEEE